jgi:hypothetical protein
VRRLMLGAPRVVSQMQGVDHGAPGWMNTVSSSSDSSEEDYYRLWKRNGHGEIRARLSGNGGDHTGEFKVLTKWSMMPALMFSTHSGSNVPRRPTPQCLRVSVHVLRSPGAGGRCRLTAFRHDARPFKTPSSCSHTLSGSLRCQFCCRITLGAVGTQKRLAVAGDSVNN